MSLEKKEEQAKVINEIKEQTLLKENVKWLKLKHGDMHIEVKSIRIALNDLTSRLFIDKKTGDVGYLGITKDLLKKHFLTNKRIDRLEVIKKFIWTSMVIGSGAIGWVLKIIYDKI